MLRVGRLSERPRREENWHRLGRIGTEAGEWDIVDVEEIAEDRSVPEVHPSRGALLARLRQRTC